MHALTGCEDRTMVAAQAVPERRVRTLQRLHDHRHVVKVEPIALIVDAVAGEALVEDIENVIEIPARLAKVHPIGLELHRGNTAPEADVESPIAEMIEHAQLLEQPQRMVEREKIEQRAEPDALCLARSSGEEHAG